MTQPKQEAYSCITLSQKFTADENTRLSACMRYFTPEAKFKFLQNPMSMKKNKRVTQKPANYR